MKYKLKIIESREAIVIIEASNIRKAFNIAKKKWDNGEIETEPCNLECITQLRYNPDKDH